MAVAIAPKRKAHPLVRAITNPNEYISNLLPTPKEPDPNAKRLSDSKFARAIGGGGARFHYGLDPRDRKQELPPADSPLVTVKLGWTLKEKLPNGYNVRCLQRDDFDRGYTKLKAVGPISRSAWDERCEYLRSRSDTYVVLVITDYSDMVVCTGTLLVERKFMSGMCMVGHAQDLCIAPDQQGKNLGLRMLDCLDSVAKDMGCYKLVASTQESNEPFYKQKGFKHTGVEMTLHYFAPNQMSSKKENTQSRDASPHDVEKERAAAAERLSGPEKN